MTPQNKNNDTAKVIIRDVKVYLSSVQVTDESDKKTFKHERTGKIFKQYEEKKMYKPTTRAKKLRRLKLDIKFIIQQQDDQQLNYEGSRIIDVLDEWCHGLGRDIGMQRQQHAILMREKLHQISDPNEFSDHKMVCIAPPSYPCVIFSSDV